MRKSLAFFRDELLAAILPASDATAATCVAGSSYCTYCSSTYSKLIKTSRCTDSSGYTWVITHPQPGCTC